MSRLTSEYESYLPPALRGGRRGRLARAWREEPEGPPVGLLVAGAVAIGLGALAWAYLGPDLRRYMKIRSM
jgi:hypothetical protein